MIYPTTFAGGFSGSSIISSDGADGVGDVGDSGSYGNETYTNKRGKEEKNKIKHLIYYLNLCAESFADTYCEIMPVIDGISRIFDNF